LIDKFKFKSAYLKDYDEYNNAKALKRCDIVALTTTGCAKYSSLLSNVKFPIVIVEEAAEVFEAHILTSIS
jgi:hypothetical protein